MPSQNRPAALAATLAAVLISLSLTAPLFAADSEQVLYKFCSVSGCADGADPYYGNLVFDANGNLYGTTTSGGKYGSGAVFKLNPGTGGSWTETVLYSFCASLNCPDGQSPYSGVIFDAAGNLYGTTQGGGLSSACQATGCGTVFELSPGANGKWTEKVLHSFNPSANDGAHPFASLIFDPSGNLYGTTPAGGLYAGGIVFELVPGQNGVWTEKILHSFKQGVQDGRSPYASLVRDVHGNLYGTTVFGGANSCNGLNCGTVFEVSPGQNGLWAEKVLHNFSRTGQDGYFPYGGLIFDAAGNLYGTTSSGGSIGGGAVFELTPGTGGTWTEKALYGFGSGTDGGRPEAGLIFDAAGNLYGTTVWGGAYGYGTVFKLITGMNGTWTDEILHGFNNNGQDGIWPYAGLISDASGNLYGYTSSGANGISCGCGVVFEVTP